MPLKHLAKELRNWYLAEPAPPPLRGGNNCTHRTVVTITVAKAQKALSTAFGLHERFILMMDFALYY